MRAHNPPLVPLTAATRQIRFDSLTPFKKSLFQFAFPGFFDAVPANPPAVNPSAFDVSSRDAVIKSIMDLHLQFKNCRRYAGDLMALYGPRHTDLPRQCYHALAGPDGTDAGLLRNELLAYGNFAQSGGFMLMDCLIEHERKLMNFPEGNKLLFLLMGQSGKRLFELLSGEPGLSQHEGRPIASTIDCEFRTFQADRVLDLRRPDARAWFYEAFSDFSSLKGPLDPGLADALSAEKPPGGQFEHMLHTLCNTSRGGGWQSQIIGIVMRRLQVEALVFPSARCDPYVRVVDGAVSDWRGWNIVDYRGSPPPLDLKEAGIHVSHAPVLGPDNLAAKVTGQRLKGDWIKQSMLLIDPFWTDTLTRPNMTITVSSRPEEAGTFSVDGLDDAINKAWSDAFQAGVTQQEPAAINPGPEKPKS